MNITTESNGVDYKELYEQTLSEVKRMFEAYAEIRTDVEDWLGDIINGTISTVTPENRFTRATLPNGDIVLFDSYTTTVDYLPSGC
jgi:hypothetical protein